MVEKYTLELYRREITGFERKSKNGSLWYMKQITVYLGEKWCVTQNTGRRQLQQQISNLLLFTGN
ncbi:hypothetical protein CW304_03120 [Bacillus sp. UFRGS-B20]|nr:hypothetical protein CW304_03120 [Bacillus sp. UFRGS-B20]